MTIVHSNVSESYLAFQGLISANQQLLACLSCCIKGTLYLYPAERTVAEQSAVFTSKGSPLGHTLVNDIGTHFSQTVNVGFARAVVASFYRVIKQAVSGVPIILVVFGSVNSPLSRNRVCPSWGILKTKCLYFIPHLTQRSCC